MGSNPGTDFSKKWRCPTSHDLDSYRRCIVESRQESDIANHLANCDFCASELQLLSKLSLADNQFECPPMPASLQALAEALLGNEQMRSQGFRRLLAV
jgi:hypothetical protein